MLQHLHARAMTPMKPAREKGFVQALCCLPLSCRRRGGERAARRSWRARTRQIDGGLHLRRTTKCASRPSTRRWRCGTSMSSRCHVRPWPCRACV